MIHSLSFRSISIVPLRCAARAAHQPAGSYYTLCDDESGGRNLGKKQVEHDKRTEERAAVRQRQRQRQGDMHASCIMQLPQLHPFIYLAIRSTHPSIAGPCLTERKQPACSAGRYHAAPASSQPHSSVLVELISSSTQPAMQTAGQLLACLNRSVRKWRAWTSQVASSSS